MNRRSFFGGVLAVLGLGGAAKSTPFETFPRSAAGEGYAWEVLDPRDVPAPIAGRRVVYTKVNTRTGTIYVPKGTVLVLPN